MKIYRDGRAIRSMADLFFTSCFQPPPCRLAHYPAGYGRFTSTRAGDYNGMPVMTENNFDSCRFGGRFSWNLSGSWPIQILLSSRHIQFTYGWNFVAETVARNLGRAFFDLQYRAYSNRE